VLVCPSCATGHDDGERFCGRCGVPLVDADASAPRESERRERARKIRPQYAEGPLVKVVGARNQAEAELLQGLLLEEGIPSFLKRTRGFDVPDFLAAGPRDILVPQAGAEAARDVLTNAVIEGEGGEGGQTPLAASGPDTSPARLLGWILVGLAAAAVIVWILYQLTG